MQKPLTRPSATLPMNPWEHRTSNIQHPIPNRQSMAQLETIGCSMLDVGCWMFSVGSWVQCATFSGNSLPIGWGGEKGERIQTKESKHYEQEIFIHLHHRHHPGRWRVV